MLTVARIACLVWCVGVVMIGTTIAERGHPVPWIASSLAAAILGAGVLLAIELAAERRAEQT